MTKLENLICLLKVTYEDLTVLHHNVVGDEWFATHEKLAEYYGKIAEMTDATTEVAISLGTIEPSIKTAIAAFPTLEEGATYTRDNAYQYCYNAFQDLINAFEATKAEVPEDVYNNFENFIYWLRIEANYKLSHALNK